MRFDAEWVTLAAPYAKRFIHMEHDGMKFGLLYEHQLPRPWNDENSDYQLLKNAIEQVELADRLGFDYIWENEHHFLEEYSHSSAPEVFLAYCARNTQHIHLGHAVVLSPPGYNHPARVAERIATLDLLSDGRVEFGTGESASRVELEGFGIDPRTKKSDVGRGRRTNRQYDDHGALPRF